MDTMKKIMLNILIILGLSMFFMICDSNNYVAAAEATVASIIGENPVFEVKKGSYNETNGELKVIISLKEGSTISSYTLDLGYSNTKGSITNISENNDFGDLTNIALKINHIEDQGRINIELSENQNASATYISKDYILYTLTYNLKEDYLEEDIPDNIFSINELLINGTDYFGSIDTVAPIGKMAKTVSAVQLIDPVFDRTNIAQTLNNNNEFFHRDNINLIGGTAKIYYENAANQAGQTREISLAVDNNGNYVDSKGIVVSADNISVGPWTADCNNPNISIRYKNVESKDITVIVRDYIEQITLDEENSKKDYEYGDSLGSIKFNVKKASKANAESLTINQLKELGGVTITGFDSGSGPQKIVEQNIKVTFDDSRYRLDMNFNVTIKDKVTNITLKQPKKEHYKIGESLNLEEGKIIIEMLSSSEENGGHGNIEIPLSEITWVSEKANNKEARSGTEKPVLNGKGSMKMTGFDNSSYGDKKISLTYYYEEDGVEKNKDFEFTVTIDEAMQFISLTKDTVTVECGSALDSTTLTDEYKIIPTMTDGTTRDAVQITKDNIVGTYDLNKEGTYNVKVSYNGFEKDFTIIVIDPITNIKLEDDEKSKITTEYLYEEELKLNGAQLTVVKASGEYKIDLTKEMIKNYNPKEIGIQKLNIQYVGFEIKEAFEIEVKDKIVDIVLVKPDKTTYLPTEELDLAGATVKTISASGKFGEEVRVTKDMISGYDNTKKGTQTITVAYEGFKKYFEIEIIDPIIEIKLEDDEKSKITAEYLYGEELKLNGAQLTVVKASGEYKIDLTKEMIKNYNPKEIGTQKLNIQYAGFEIKEAFEVEIKDYIVDIVLEKPNKTTYLPTEELDLTGATVRTLSASGILGEEVPVTEDMISGYDNTKKGTQKITVKYEGFEKTFNVIFTVQTGATGISPYTIFGTMLITSVSLIIIILAMEKRQKFKNRKL